MIWQNKKQNVVVRSSVEAKYRVTANGICEGIWIKSFSEEISFHFGGPISLYCDNQAAIHIANNPVFHERTKYIEIDCHLVRERVMREIILNVLCSI